MTTSNQSVYIIDGVKLTVGTNIHTHYNLSILKRYSHHIIANEYYDQKRPILDPLNWIKSDEGQNHIYKIYSKTDNIIRLLSYYPITIYTTSFYVWLGYLKYCISNIDTAINAELVNYNLT